MEHAPLAAHPLQYAYCRNVYVADTEDMSDEDVQRAAGGAAGLVERYNRCPICEQWSPCDVRRAVDAPAGQRRGA